MDVSKFLGLNIGIVGLVLLVVFIYLVVLINKRRTNKFLHNNQRNNKKE